MTMWKSLASPLASRSWPRLAGLILLFSLSMLLNSPSLAPASVQGGVPFHHPKIPGTLISCFDKNLDRFVDKTRPARCEIAGYEGPHGRHFVSASINGIKWGQWGAFRSRGALGVNVHTGTRVRVFAYRRIRCGDGRTFYSSANIVDLRNGNYFWLRLPVCDDPAPRS